MGLPIIGHVVKAFAEPLPDRPASGRRSARSQASGSASRTTRAPRTRPAAWEKRLSTLAESLEQVGQRGIKDAEAAAATLKALERVAPQLPPLVARLDRLAKAIPPEQLHEDAATAHRLIEQIDELSREVPVRRLLAELDRGDKVLGRAEELLSERSVRRASQNLTLGLAGAGLVGLAVGILTKDATLAGLGAMTDGGVLTAFLASRVNPTPLMPDAFDRGPKR